jgi:drug/metabolite transporter (DMT)-like permease
MKNQTTPIILTLVASVCGAGANLLFKKSSQQILEIPVYQNYFLIIGLILFSSVLILFLTAFRLGGETVVIYPTYATTYIWIIFLSNKFENVPINNYHILGMLLISAGVSVIGFAMKSNSIQ